MKNRADRRFHPRRWKNDAESVRTASGIKRFPQKRHRIIITVEACVIPLFFCFIAL
jgi:hypothetical protein